MKKICGIYFIMCIINKKMYIGSAINIDSRLKRHYNDLNKNKHHSIHLQRAYKKYGSNNFIDGILEICEKNEDIVSIEKKWIFLFESFKRSNGFNILKEPNNRLGIKHNNKTKKLISKNNYSKGKFYENSIRGSKKVYQYDLSDNLVKKWNSLKEPSDVLKITHQNIQKCCAMERKSAGNYRWFYKYQGKKIEPLKKNKPIYQLDLNDNIINEFDKISDITKKYKNYNTSVIWSVLNKIGGRKTAYGYKWKYKNKCDEK